MKGLAGVLFLIGIVALATPLMRDQVPFLDGFDDATLRIAGGSLLVLGGVAYFMSRDT